MSDKSELLQRIEETLSAVIELLLEERDDVVVIPEGPQAQWDLFRALVNTRPPAPASEGLIVLQDRLLQDILEYRGVMTLDDIPPVAGRDRVRLWRGDITTLGVDAIVNAANSQMLGCFVPGHHCIDNAIHTFAGIQLRLECARLMEEQGYPEPTGMAKVTSAFNLPSRRIIHTVGPIARGEASDLDRALLANCYIACLDAALEAGCDSIALCCISTGVFGFPQDEAAQIAVGAVDEWLDGHGNALDAVFNVYGETDERLYRELLECAEIARR